MHNIPNFYFECIAELQSVFNDFLFVITLVLTVTISKSI